MKDGFKVGDICNKKIKAIKKRGLKKRNITLYNVDGNYAWISDKIHFYDEKTQILELPAWLYNLKF